MTEVKSLTFTSLILWAISGIGGFLVANQIITGEQLTELQGIIGIALAGGGITASAIIYAIKVIVPSVVVKLLVGNVKKTNPELYTKLVELFKNPEPVLSVVSSLTSDIKRILELEEAKAEILNDLTE